MSLLLRNPSTAIIILVVALVASQLALASPPAIHAAEKYNPDRFPSLNISLGRSTTDAGQTFELYPTSPGIRGEADSWRVSYKQPINGWFTMTTSYGQRDFDIRTPVDGWVHGYRQRGTTKTYALSGTFYFNKKARQ